MPIIFTDKCTCDKCGKPFEWNCFELTRQRGDSSKLKVESISQGKILVHHFQKKKLAFMILRLIVLIVILIITLIILKSEKVINSPLCLQFQIHN